MKLIRLVVVALLLAMPVSSYALNVYGVQVEGNAVVNGQTLQLNGFGLRTKWFVKVYIGSLYLAKQAKSGAEVINSPGDKLIRLNFLHSKVTKDKIIEAIEEGFVKNSTGFANSEVARHFLALFTRDFVKGDVLNITFGADGSVSMQHNANTLGTIESKPLQTALLKAFLGLHPADEALKAGMLGRT